MRHSYTLRQTRQSRRGTVAVLVALCLVILLGVAALALDGGLMYDRRRHVTSAAEAAASGAAYHLFSATNKAIEANDGKPVSQASLSQAAVTFGKQIAAENGYPNDGVRSHVEINIPPKSGQYAGKAGYIEAIVRHTSSRTFSSIFGRDALSVKGRAVACGTYVPTKASILVLDPKKKKAASFSDASLQLDGDLIVNSKDKHALSLKKKSEVIADNVIVSGGIERKAKDNTSLEGELSTGVPATPDPLADLPVPPKGASRKLSDQLTTVGKQRFYDLHPGAYNEKLEFKDNDVVRMSPGTYFIEKEGLRIKGQASLLAEEVMIYNASKKEMKFETTGTVQITPQQDGPYAGISLFQSRSTKGKIKFRKDADLSIAGTIYAPNGEVRFQHMDAVLGEIPDDPEDDEDMYTGSDDLSGQMTYAKLSAQIITARFKIDKHSVIRLTGTGIDAFKPYVGIVE